MARTDYFDEFLISKNNRRLGNNDGPQAPTGPQAPSIRPAPASARPISVNPGNLAPPPIKPKRFNKLICVVTHSLVAVLVWKISKWHSSHQRLQNSEI